MKRAAQMLLVAKNPLILAGAGIHYARPANGWPPLPSLFPAPVATTTGQERDRRNHPLSLGASTRSRPKMYTDFMAKADVVLAIGSSLTKTPFGPGVPAGQDHHPLDNDAGDVNKEYTPTTP